MGAGLKAPDGTPIDERVGSYVLRRYLTQGGMAALYLGHHVDGREVVVAKRVLPQFSRDLSFTRMFSREAQLAAMLRHPNIVQVYDTGALETEGCYFIMEYIHGVDLSRFLGVLRDRNLSMPLDHALTVALGLCAGLDYAHNMAGADGTPLEIVHRDVSPSNVMLSYGGQIKVMDFGVAKALALTSFTEAGTRKGKLSYMAPEQARADELDRRADVFAIGAVLYELTTMRRLFSGGNELAVIHQLMYEERTRPSTVIPGYPPSLEKIVLKAVEHKPEDRYESAAHMQTALEEFARSAGLKISEATLGAFVREQITPPPHPAEDPEFFGKGAFVTAVPDAATTVEAAHDTSIEPYSDGGGLSTNAVLHKGAASAYPTTTAPYVAAPPVGVAPSTGAGPAAGNGLSGGARLGIAAAAVLTLAASGGVAFLMTRGGDSPAAAGVDGATPPAAEQAAGAAESKAEPTPVPTPVAIPPVEDTPVVDAPGDDANGDPVVVDPPAGDGPEPVEFVEALDDPVASADATRPQSGGKKKKKKKASPTPASTASDPPPKVADPAPDPAEPKKKKKKRNPTDTLLPIVGD